MTLRATHPGRIAIAAAVALVLTGLLLLAATSVGGSSRAAVLRQLERPAAPPAVRAPRLLPVAHAVPAGPGPVRLAISAGQFKLDLRISPNHAPVRNEMSVLLARRGAPVSGARVTVSYTMPAMGMGDLLTNKLSAHPGGVYSVREPVLGMAGVWVMRFRVQLATGAPFVVAVSDVLR